MPDHGGVPAAFSAGPETVVPGITWTSTTGDSVFGYTGDYTYLANGLWVGGSFGPMAGLNSVTDTMTFTFSAPVSAVGGFINYGPGTALPTSIAIYDGTHTLLESFDLTFDTGGAFNSGQFLGFRRDSAEISSFTLTDNYIGITNLTIEGGAVSEPGTLMLLGAGMAGLAARRRRPQ